MPAAGSEPPGEPVPLDEVLTRSVAFIVDATGGVIGTGFVVQLYGHPSYWYVVTAAHVVSEVVAPGDPWVEQGGTKVRIRQTASGVTDKDVDGWIFHPAADVAITPHVPSSRHAVKPLYLNPSAVAQFAHPQYWQPKLGDLVYFVGQLYFMESMNEQNIPMVRSGTVGAINQQHIPIDWFGNGHADEIVGHLIDCRSYFGFSGSPCFAQTPHLATKLGDPFTQQLELSNQLFGMISGHFSWPQEFVLTRTGKPGSNNFGTVHVNAGVGIVTPIERLYELLQDDDVIRMRNEDIDKRELEREPTPAVGDRASVATREFDQMTDVTRTFLQVPKSDADDVHRGHDG